MSSKQKTPAELSYEEKVTANLKKMLAPSLKQIIKEHKPSYRITGVKKAELQTQVESLLKTSKRAAVIKTINSDPKAVYKDLPSPDQTNPSRPAKRPQTIVAQPASTQKKTVSVVNAPVAAQPTSVQPTSIQPALVQPAPAQKKAVSAVNEPVVDQNHSALFTPSPFYEVKKVIVAPTKLKPTQAISAKMAKTTILFKLPKEYMPELSESNDSLPRYEVQLRMTATEGEKVIENSYPYETKLLLNYNCVQLPASEKPVGVRVGGEGRPKIVAMPIDLTPNCKQNSDEEQKLIISWEISLARYDYGIWIVKHLTPSIIHDRFVASGPKLLTGETVKMIEKTLTNEDEISAEFLKVSLHCPLSGSRILTPVRSKQCNHIQCFDFNSYLLMNEKRPKWKCPICSNLALYGNLVFDSYFKNIIENSGENNFDIQLFADGRWQAVKLVRQSQATGKKHGRSTYVPASSMQNDRARNIQPIPEESIIVLDESDDEPRAKKANRNRSIVRPYAPEISIITLD